jgi:Rps23 Pro-64 3,4-dihydroxylase Tpa1-like proline 4-hydroxylase
MDCVLQTSQCAVFDNVLPPEQFESLWKHIQLVDYQSVHSNKWNKAWRLHDGHALGGPEIRWADQSEADTASHSQNTDSLTFPTHSIMDALIQTVLSKATDHPELVGTRGDAWQTMTARSYVYPAGTGLSWHTDGLDNGIPIYSGAFSYYAHPEWNSVYGGELLVSSADASTIYELLPHVMVYEMENNEIKDLKKRFVGAHLDNSAEDKLLNAAGLGLYIVPKPNRLVLMKGGTYHHVNPVSATAGRFSRISVSGFFEVPSDRPRA